MAESMEDSSSSADETLMDDDEFNRFTENLDKFDPVIPETVTKFYMKQSGIQTDDERAVKLISVTVQKFMSEIINDCFQLHKLREKSNNRVPPPTTAGATATATATTNAPNLTAEVAAAVADAAAGKKPVVTSNNTLTLNELTHVLDEYGINVKKTFYYT